jgi:phospholipid/cholesterol/gamma-HCH transport system substrate-binding protein
MRKQFIQNLIVGIFFFTVLIYGMVFIYQTSETGSILVNKIYLTTHMKNANGIKNYTSIRVHGIPVGKAESVKFSEKPGEDLIYIEMSVSSDYVGKIAIGNPDPKAPVKDPEGVFGYFFISSEGLLGDNLLDIYAGDPTRATEAAKKSVRAWATREIKEEWEKETKEWDDEAAGPEIEERYKKLIVGVDGLENGHVTDGMYLPTKKGGGGLAAMTESLDPTLARINDLLDAAKSEPGLINTLIYDEKGKELVYNLNETVAKVDLLLGDIRKGPGGLHEVIYGNQIKMVMNDLTGISEQLKGAMTDVNKVTGDIQILIADVKEKGILDNVKGTLANVEGITQKINDGEGTLGALITDKSVYEDLQEIMGGAKRSTVIKEAVRYIKSKNKKEAKEPLPEK